MRLRLARLAAWSSLAASVCLIAFWIVSYWWTFGLTYQSRSVGGGVNVTGGRLVVGWADSPIDRPGRPYLTVTRGVVTYPSGLLGFDYKAFTSGRVRQHFGAAPMWFAVIPPVLTGCAFGWRLSSRRSAGRGFDLSAASRGQETPHNPPLERTGRRYSYWRLEAARAPARPLNGLTLWRRVRRAP